MVYYRIDAGSREVVHTTFLDHDDLGRYEFRLVQAERGWLTCVYEVTRATHNDKFLLMFDHRTGESWPRGSDNVTSQRSEELARWQERYRRIKAEHPDLPTPVPFDY